MFLKKYLIYKVASITARDDFHCHVELAFPKVSRLSWKIFYGGAYVTIFLGITLLYP